MTRPINPTPNHIARLAKYTVRREGDACWGWLASTDEHGYGRIRIDWVEYGAHRLSYAIHYGVDPGALAVCHRCDNPTCTNPNHLFIGTHQENIRDAVSKGRWAHKGAGASRNAGGRNPMAKLTDEQRREIRARYKQGGILQREIAAQYGVARPTITGDCILDYTGQKMNKINGQADTFSRSTGKSAKPISENEERKPITAINEGVTPDMITEGVAELLSYGDADEISRTSYAEIVQSVYLAMQRAASPIPCRESERL